MPDKYQSLTLYDSPWIAAKQLIDGEASWSSMRDTFLLDDLNLSPQQRDGLLDGVKKATGDNPLVNATIDVITNPMVLLAAAFSPAGATSIRAGGQVFMDAARTSKLPTIFRTSWQLLSGTAGGKALHDVIENMRHVDVLFSSKVTGAEDNLIKALGIKPSQWARPEFIRDTAIREKVERAKTILEANLSGLDKATTVSHSEYMPRFVRSFDRSRTVETDPEIIQQLWEKFSTAQRSGTGVAKPIFVKVGGKNVKYESAGGPFVMQRLKDERTLPLIADNTEVMLDEIVGLREYRDSVRDAMLDTSRLLFMKSDVDLSMVKAVIESGDEKAYAALLDDRKIIRQWSGLKDVDIVKRDPSLYNTVSQIVGDNTAFWVGEGKMSAKEFSENVKRSFMSRMQARDYFPRNNIKPYSSKGGVASELEKQFGANRPLTSSGRAHSRASTEASYTPEYYDRLAKHLSPTDHLRGEKARVLNTIKENAGDRLNPRQTLLQHVDLLENLSLYRNQAGRDYGLFVAPVSKRVIEAQKRVFAKMKDAGTDVWEHERFPRDLKEGAEASGFYRDFESNVGSTPGGWSNAWVLEQAAAMVPMLEKGKTATRVRELLTKTAIPAALGTLHHDHALIEFGVRASQVTSDLFRKSFLGKAMADGQLGGKWKDVMHSLKVFAEDDAARYVKPTTSGTASLLYSSHLGFNVGSIILNMQQPFLHLAGTVGVDNVLRAYKDAGSELAAYLKARSKLGARISPERRRRLAEKHIPFAREAGLHGDMLEEFDRVAFSGRVRTEGKGRFWGISVPMKAFEKAEWMNRLVTTHAVKHLYAKEGRIALGRGGVIKDAADTPQFRNLVSDIERTVQETQFGSDLLNTPMAFLGGRGGSLGTALANPLIRQFQTFALRAPMSLFSIGAEVGAGKRHLRGPLSVFEQGPLRDGIPWWVADPIRIAGIGAAISEIGQNVFDADLSRGTGLGALTDFVGGGRFLYDEREFPVPLPPIFDMGLNASRALAGDMSLMKDVIARTIPGGIALQRAMGVSPDIPTILGAPQKTYADWHKPNRDGNIPIYKHTGELIEFRSPTELLAQGLGADLGKYRKEGELVGMLMRNGPEMSEMKRNVLRALQNGDAKGVQDISAAYQKKYGIQMRIEDAQIKSWQKARTVPRFERALDRLPREAREAFYPYMEQRLHNIGLSREAIRAGQTSTQRTRLDPGSRATLDAPFDDVSQVQQRLGELIP